MASGLNFGWILFLRLSHGCEPFETESDGDRLLIVIHSTTFAHVSFNLLRKKSYLINEEKTASELPEVECPLKYFFCERTSMEVKNADAVQRVVDFALPSPKYRR